MSSKPTIVRRDGALYRVLFEAFQEHRSKQGLLDIPRLAKEIEKRNETVYKALRHDDVSPNTAHLLLKLAHENHPTPTLFWDDLFPFVLPEFEKYRRPADDDDALLA